MEKYIMLMDQNNQYYKVFNFPKILLDIDKLSVKFTENFKGRIVGKTVLQKDTIGGFTLPDSENYHKGQQSGQ